MTPEQRNQIQRGLNQGQSIRCVARQIDRSPSTVSREIRRGLARETNDAVPDRDEAQMRRRKRVRKPLEGARLSSAVKTRFPANKVVSKVIPFIFTGA